MLNKKKPQQDITLSEISSRIRGFLFDSQVSDPEHISVLLGCSVISAEGADHEAQESDSRVSRISRLMPIMYAYAHSMAEGVVEHQRAHAVSENNSEPIEVSEESWAATRRIFTQIAMNTLVGAVSQMVDMEFLSVDKKKGWFR
jgi:hypothetical protein